MQTAEESRGTLPVGARASLGEVEFDLNGRRYIARFGNRELAGLEVRWGVEGLGAIYQTGVQKSNARFVEFAMAALSRHQPDLTEGDVADLLDYRDADDRRVATEAIVAAFEAAVPKKKAVTTPGATPTPMPSPRRRA